MLLTLDEDEVDSVIVVETDGEDAAALLELDDVVVVVVMKIVCYGSIPIPRHAVL